MEFTRINPITGEAASSATAMKAGDVFELARKTPLVVLNDADLDEAVKAAAFGAFINQGQICMSTERIIVVESVADALIDKSAAKAASMPVGYGRFGGRQGIDSFTETRWITIESQPGHYPI